jgi:hypothetical protein
VDARKRTCLARLIRAQRQAVILVGAQAVYLHTGAVELAVAAFTTDADLTLDPALLQPAPEIESAMTAAGFHRGNRVGAWVVSRDIDGTPTNVEVDLMVPEAVGGGGSRAARLVGHAQHVARKARGLEAALIDKRTTLLAALDAADRRSFTVAAAGPAALIVSKMHKIRERLEERAQRRLDDKDALDVLRLLQATATAPLAATFVQLLRADVSKTVTDEALKALKELSPTREPSAHKWRCGRRVRWPRRMKSPDHVPRSRRICWQQSRARASGNDSAPTSRRASAAGIPYPVMVSPAAGCTLAPVHESTSLGARAAAPRSEPVHSRTPVARIWRCMALDCRTGQAVDAECRCSRRCTPASLRSRAHTHPMHWGYSPECRSW